MTYEPSTDHEATDGTTRRNLLTVAAAAGLLSAAGSAQASTKLDDPVQATDSAVDDAQFQQVSAATTTSGGLDVGGRLVVGDGGYETIQGAWDDANDGDTVYVHSSYDAEAAGEAFPIVIDQQVKEVAIVGGHPSGSEISARHAPEQNILEVYGAGHHDFRNTPLIQNLKLVGGNVGLLVAGAPNAAFSHLKFFLTESHAVHITTTSEVDRGTFGTRWYDCEAWSCGGSGFHIDEAANAHGTTFLRCNSTWNGYNGNHPGVALAGFSSVWSAGTIQRSSGHGIQLRSGSAQVVRDTYFEGNGMHVDGPTQLRAEGTLGLVIDGCYFLGRMQSASGAMPGESPHDRVDRAIDLVNAKTTSVRNCSTWHHGSGFVAVRGSYAEDNDLHLHSHHSIKGSDDLLVGDSGIRTRSNGMIREQDMREIEGKFSGDQGIHDGSGGRPWGPVMWTGSQWRSLVDGQRL